MSVGMSQQNALTAAPTMSPPAPEFGNELNTLGGHWLLGLRVVLHFVDLNRRLLDWIPRMPMCVR